MHLNYIASNLNPREKNELRIKKLIKYNIIMLTSLLLFNLSLRDAFSNLGISFIFCLYMLSSNETRI